MILVVIVHYIDSPFGIFWTEPSLDPLIFPFFQVNHKDDTNGSLKEIEMDLIALDAPNDWWFNSIQYFLACLGEREDISLHEPLLAHNSSLPRQQRFNKWISPSNIGRFQETRPKKDEWNGKYTCYRKMSTIICFAILKVEQREVKRRKVLFR